MVVVLRHGQRIGMDFVARVCWWRYEEAVHEVDASVERAGVDHVFKLVFDVETSCGKLGCHLVECDAAEGNKVLHDALAANARVYVGKDFGEVDVEEIVVAVAFKDFETGAVFGVAEEVDGASDVRLELEEVAEFAVGEHLILQVAAVHGGESAEAAVHGYVVGRDNVFLPCDAGRGFGGHVCRRRAEKVGGGFAEVADGHGCETTAGRHDGVELDLVVALELCSLDLCDVCLNAEPGLLCDADVYKSQGHVGEVFVGSAVFAHFHVGLVCVTVVARVEEEVTEVLVAHLVASALFERCAEGKAYPYALLDQVVLVRLELVLQPVLLLLCLTRLLLRPLCVQ